MAQKIMEEIEVKTMFKIVIAVFLILFFAERSFAGDYNFRKTKWGMTIAEVKASEPLDVVKEDGNLLFCKTSVINKDVVVIYFFVDKQLARARYLLFESHTTQNDFITDYNDFKKILTKKYGKPKQDKTIWKNDLYKNDVSGWGMAVSLGHLLYLSAWETQDTEIDNMLFGENYKITCIVEYRSKKLKGIADKAEEKKALDAF